MSNFQHHDDDTCPHLVRANLLEAENARLKAENERLRKAGGGLYGIAYNAGPGEGRVEKLDAWRAAKEGKSI